MGYHSSRRNIQPQSPETILLMHVNGDHYSRWQLYIIRVKPGPGNFDSARITECENVWGSNLQLLKLENAYLWSDWTVKTRCCSIVCLEWTIWFVLTVDQRYMWCILLLDGGGCGQLSRRRWALIVPAQYMGLLVCSEVGICKASIQILFNQRWFWVSYDMIQ